MSMYYTLADTLVKYDRLRCYRCERELPLSKDDSARYFATGWPRCCGETMKLATARVSRLPEESPKP